MRSPGHAVGSEMVCCCRSPGWSSPGPSGSRLAATWRHCVQSSRHAAGVGVEGLSTGAHRQLVS